MVAVTIVHSKSPGTSRGKVSLKMLKSDYFSSYQVVNINWKKNPYFIISLQTKEEKDLKKASLEGKKIELKGTL